MPAVQRSCQIGKGLIFVGFGAGGCRRAAISCRSAADFCRFFDGESLEVLQTMSRLFDPAALALVGLGSVATAALRSTGEDIGAALKA